jgi:hypothetical protein
MREMVFAGSLPGKQVSAKNLIGDRPQNLSALFIDGPHLDADG